MHFCKRFLRYKDVVSRCRGLCKFDLRKTHERTWSVSWMLQLMLFILSFFAIHTRLQSNGKDVTLGVFGIGSSFLDIRLRYMYSILSANASAITLVGSAFTPSDWMLVVLTGISAAKCRFSALLIYLVFLVYVTIKLNNNINCCF